MAEKVVNKAQLELGFEKMVTNCILKLIPWSVPANMLTLFGNFCVVLALGSAWLSYHKGLMLWPCIPFLICCYLICDCLDGDQARRTNTCSPLGEFLDHFFDILIAGQLLAMVIFAFDIDDPYFEAAVISAAYLALFGTYYEQYYTKTMVFEAISNFELILLGTLLCCLGFSKAGLAGLVRAVFKHTVIGNWTVIACVLTVCAGFSAILMLRSFLRTGKAGKIRYTVFLPLMFIVVFFSAKLFGQQPYASPIMMIVVTLYCASYVEQFLVAYLTKKKEPVPDFVFPLLLILASVLQINQTLVTRLALAYQLIGITVVFLRGVIPLRHGWVWVNPERTGD